MNKLYFFKKLSKKDIYSLIVILVSIPILMSFFIGSSDTEQLRADLDERGVTTMGVIYEKKYVIKSKNIYKYNFNVGKSRYTGNFSGSVLWKLYEGDSIQIRYDPLNPARNERVKVPVESKKVSPLFWIIMIPILVYCVYSRIRDIWE